PSVDLEHREMIAMINECHQRIEEDAKPETIERYLGEIYTGIGAHFALEESMMRRAAYAEYEAHKQDHEELLDQIRDMMDLYDQDIEAGRRELQEKLSDWFGRHFATFDARLHDQLG
ncbi:MAG: hemerythrin family protein, partial [Xanthomonadales bacterium]|nr:hemerythrin family protein [Xanthomonadales bacterium]